jgi:ParB-like chromosome segregation protein Spo0J
VNAIMRPARYVTLRLAAIEVPPPLLAYHATRTVELAKAIRAGKAIEPLTVTKKSGRFVLIQGKDEFAALKLVGAEAAPVRIVDDIRLTWRERRLAGRKPQ